MSNLDMMSMSSYYLHTSAVLCSHSLQLTHATRAVRRPDVLAGVLLSDLIGFDDIDDVCDDVH
jgi:hypothetical protein